MLNKKEQTERIIQEEEEKEEEEEEEEEKVEIDSEMVWSNPGGRTRN